MRGKNFFLSLAASFLIAALCACGSSPSTDEITPVYQGFPGQEFPFEETAETDTSIPNLQDDLPEEPQVQEPIAEEQVTEEQITEEQIAEEPPEEEPLPEVAEDEEPSPEVPVEEDQETLESLRETVEALRETVEALREVIEALRATPPETPPSVPPAPVETPPPVVEPPPLAPEPPPPETPAPTPPPPLPVQEPPAPEPPPPEPEPPPPEPAPEPPLPAPPPPPAPPPEPPSYLGPAEPFNPPPVIEPFTPAPPPELPDRVIPETPEEDIVFSRIVRVTVGQILEIPFRGTGWVYLGELGNRRGINYESRRLDLQAGSRLGQEVVEGQSFIFSVDRAGTYILRFYRQDFIQDYIINDNVQVIAGERDENTGRITGDRVIAEPRWPPVAETVERPATAVQAVPPVVMPEPSPEASPSVTAPEYTPPAAAPVTPQAPPPVESPSEYVRRARAEFDTGRIESALGILDSFSQNYPGGTDDAWWLYGQLLEANSPSRDVRLAMDYYRRLVNDFPFSDLVEDARRRIAYLERFYFNIR